jgi:hypothetical protein
MNMPRVHFGALAIVALAAAPSRDPFRHGRGLSTAVDGTDRLRRLGRAAPARGAVTTLLRADESKVAVFRAIWIDAPMDRYVRP